MGADQSGLTEGGTGAEPGDMTELCTEPGGIPEGWNDTERGGSPEDGDDTEPGGSPEGWDGTELWGSP